jgi:hypothetical protein
MNTLFIHSESSVNVQDNSKQLESPKAMKESGEDK